MMYHNLGIQDIFTICFGLAELWEMLLKSLSLFYSWGMVAQASACTEFRCLSVRVSHSQKCLEAFRKCACVGIVFMYATRACFKDTGVCQSTDWQFSWHMYPWTLILQEKINMSFCVLITQKSTLLPCHFRWPYGSWPNIRASLTCTTRWLFII